MKRIMRQSNLDSLGSMDVSASIVIPTRNRPRYLERTLSSVVQEARACNAEVLVVDDSEGQTARAVAEAAGVRYIAHPRQLGANAARNTGIEASSGELLVLADDDVTAQKGWLSAFLSAADAHPETDVFAGRICAQLEGRPPRSCGREEPPITTLDHGESDTTVEFAWSANMALRRRALRRVGLFDTSIDGQGEEQEWQERLEAETDERPLYVAGAAVMHRRERDDATLRALAATTYERGRQARRFDWRRGVEPALRSELATLTRCVSHVVRYRCPNGATMVTHSCGRVAEALAERARSIGGVEPAITSNPAAEPLDDFLSGESGTVGGLDGVRRRLEDELNDGMELLSGRRARLMLAARRLPQRRVLALGVVRKRNEALAEAVMNELSRSRHCVEVATIEPSGRGKFENLRALLESHRAEGHDWLVVFDDDIKLPHGFLNSFLFLAERFRLDLAQPAHRRASHAAWEVTRRRRGSVARETRFVEIGPLTAFSSRTFTTLLPFPALKMGWGLEAHWAAVAKQHGWRCGVIDAVAMSHGAAPAAEAYSREAAIEEARAFLAEHDYIAAEESKLTLATHRRW
jgi:GT2 family glycosyltransferase